MSNNTTDLQKLYVAYYCRPADPGGMTYWQGALDAGGVTLAAIGAAFGSSKEYLDTYAGQSTSQVINTIYINLFGHAADTAGLQYWFNLINQGTVTLSEAVTIIATGAQGTDLTAYNAKVSFATSLTQELANTPGAAKAYAGAAANLVAKAAVTGVIDQTTLALAAAPAALSGAVTQISTTSDVLVAASLFAEASAIVANQDATIRLATAAAASALVSSLTADRLAAVTANDDAALVSVAAKLASAIGVAHVAATAASDAGAAASAASARFSTAAAATTLLTRDDSAAATAATTAKANASAADAVASLVAQKSIAAYTAAAADASDGSAATTKAGVAAGTAITAVNSALSAQAAVDAAKAEVLAAAKALSEANAALVIATGYNSAVKATPAASDDAAGLAAYNQATLAVKAASDAQLAASAHLAAASLLPANYVAQILALTTAKDTLLGRQADDVFNGVLNNTASTVTAQDSLDGGGGNNTFNIVDLPGGSKLPAGLAMKNIQTLNIQGNLGVNLDVSGSNFSGIKMVNVTDAAGYDFVVVGNGTAVNVVNTGIHLVYVLATDSAIRVTGGGNVELAGGSSQTATASGSFLSSGSTGAIVLNDIDQYNYPNNAGGPYAIRITDGTSVDVKTAFKASSGNNISIGNAAGRNPTGAVTVNATITGDTAADSSGVYYNNYGGSSVNVTLKASQAISALAAEGLANVNHTLRTGFVNIFGSALTSAVGFTTSATVAAVNSVTARAGAQEADAFAFAATKAGAVVSVGGLSFTASADLSAQQTAAAFANIAAGATQGGSTLGSYSGQLSASFHSGAVSGSSVTMSAASAGVIAAPVASGAVRSNITAGVAAVAAVAGVGGVDAAPVNVQDANFGTGRPNTIKSVSIDGSSNVGINSTALSTLSLSNGVKTAIVTGAGTSGTLDLSVNNMRGAALSLGSGPNYSTLNIHATGADTQLTLGGTEALTSLNLDGNKSIDIYGSNLNGLKTVTVSGAAGLLNLYVVASSLGDVNAAATSGNNSVSINAGVTSYHGGSGVDQVKVYLPVVSKAISLGAGDDTLTLVNPGSSALGATIDGGDGIDTLAMVTADAQLASASGAFQSHMTGFEKLSLDAMSGGARATVDLANLSGIGYVMSAGGGAGSTLTLNHMADNGTLELNGAAAAAIVNLTDASGTANSLNIVLNAGAGFDAGTVRADGVETVRINSISNTGSGAAANTLVNKLTLDDSAASVVTLTGTTGVTLNLDGDYALVLVDATGLKGGLQASGNGGSAITIKGGAGVNILSAGNGSSADTLVGGASADVLTANAGKDTLTGNGGADKFIIQTAAASVNGYATITDASAGDIIGFNAIGGTSSFTTTRVAQGAGAALQDYANSAVSGAAAGAIAWFQLNGDTYLVQNTQAGGSAFVDGEDLIVKLTGVVDLSHASLSADHAYVLIG